MHKAKNRTTVTVITMLVVALGILSFYFYWSFRSVPLEGTSEKNMTETERLLNLDLEEAYPETPREVVKLFGGMIKVIYDNPSDEEVKELAIKIRELYDDEFLAINPEETYLMNLYSDIAAWKEKKRRISTYYLVKQDQEQRKELEGREYATVFISYTIQENTKISETWKVMLRQNENHQWKILGWQIESEE
ncbi:hypothetical protein HNQ56_004495 [Anaerotaenia torta]|uniref:DUF6715 family protein n=1 Tax=Anaerotaenia torta TaxID=433293 RepID=UPI003D23DD1B